MYMKKSLFVMAAATVAALASCSMEPETAVEIVPDRPQTSENDDSVLPGWVRIKLSDDSQPLTTGAFTRGTVRTGNDRLDEIVDQLGVVEVRRVFRDAGKFEAKHRKHGLHLWYDLKIDDSMPVTRAAVDLSDIPGIACSEPIATARFYAAEPVVDPVGYTYAPSYGVARPALESVTLAFEKDPDLAKQWHYYNDGSVGEKAVAGADINLFEGWEKLGTYGDPSVIVAILDTGVQVDHPDLAANMWVNPGEIPGNGIDDDNNGYIDDINGYNFAKKQVGPVITPATHGTHIAGTIAAVNGNGVGVVGVAGGSGKGDGVRIMTIEWSDASNTTDVTVPNLEMYTYAADNGAVITSNSWGLNDKQYTESVRAAVDYFIQEAGTDENGVQTGPMKGGICLFAAGNAGINDKDYSVDFPGNYDEPNVIAVTSMAANYNVANYSKRGPEAGIMAPGGEISQDNTVKQYGVYSTAVGSSYTYLEGTSMATPHVSGVAALLVSKYGGPGFTNDDLRKRLLASVRPFGDAISDANINILGVGMLDAAMGAVEDPGTAPANLGTPRAIGIPDGLRITGVVPADGNGDPVVRYIWDFRVKGESEWKSVKLANNAGVGEDYSFECELVQLTDYECRIKSVDRFGNESDYASFEGTSLQHINNAPVMKGRFLDVTIKDPEKEYVRKYQLNNYFSDADIEYGDELSYEVTSTDTKVIRPEMLEPALVALNPGGWKGETTITIKCSDKFGGVTETSFKVTVQKSMSVPNCGCPSDCECGGTCGDDCQCGGDEPPVETGGLSLVSEVVSSEVSMTVAGGANSEAAVTIYDSSAREVHTSKVALSEGSGKIGVGNLAPGRYTLVVEVGAARYTASFLKR